MSKVNLDEHYITINGNDDTIRVLLTQSKELTVNSQITDSSYIDGQFQPSYQNIPKYCPDLPESIGCLSTSD